MGESFRSKEEPVDNYRIERVVRNCPPLLKVYNLVARVAPMKSAGPIQGETGTGKELIERAIHLITFVAWAAGRALANAQGRLSGKEEGSFAKS